MKPTTKRQLKGLIDRAEKNKIDVQELTTYSIGIYAIRISIPRLTPTERVKQLYRRRRAQGLCVQCGKPVKKTNKRTGKKFQKCDTCRGDI